MYFSGVMLIEELIQYDREHLRRAAPAQRLAMLAAFLAPKGFNDGDKLQYVIHILKERQIEERPPAYTQTYYVVSSCLILSVAGMAIFYGRYYDQIHFAEVWPMPMPFLIAWILLAAWRYHVKRQFKYKRLIRLIQNYYLENEVNIVPMVQ